jgi:hypothetical protein
MRRPRSVMMRGRMEKWWWRDLGLMISKVYEESSVRERKQGAESRECCFISCQQWPAGEQARCLLAFTIHNLINVTNIWHVDGLLMNMVLLFELRSCRSLYTLHRSAVAFLLFHLHTNSRPQSGNAHILDSLVKSTTNSKNFGCGLESV